MATDAEWFRYHVTLSQPSATWAGDRGRIDIERVLTVVNSPTACRFFLCGPTDFMDTLRQGLQSVGVDAERIHTEEFLRKIPATAVLS